jgi:uncharacterized zinc-type alcohol dehydrogenase-like protein
MKPAAVARDKKNSYGRDNTFGGYSTSLVVAEDFVLKIPATLKPEIAAPILCAGVTTYSPLRFWNVKPGQKVGIIGFGGLGHMAIQIAKAMGADVTVFTRTKEKLGEASKFGATAVMEDDKATFASLQANFDFILSTVPEKHDLNPFIPLLKRNCTICAVGALESMAPLNNMQVASQRKQVTGSLIGSIAETQDVLDFCGKHGIGPEVEIIDIKDINIAYEKVASGEVRFRYVIDMASLKEA